jgi:hypothetical protein
MMREPGRRIANGFIVLILLANSKALEPPL